MKGICLLKVFFILAIGIVFSVPCFSQNMIFAGGEYNIFKPQYWNTGLGFNLKVINNYFQNETMVNFGQVRAKNKQAVFRETGAVNEEGEPETEIIGYDVSYPTKFLFTVSDKFFFYYEWDWIGLRGGAFAQFGCYGIPDFPREWDLFFNIGPFAGVVILPKFIVSLALDISPGYTAAFSIKEGIVKNEDGFSLSFSASVRLNLDKF